MSFGPGRALSSSSSTRTLSMEPNKQEQLKILLVKKFSAKYGLENRELIEREVICFLRTNRLTEKTVTQLDKQVAEQIKNKNEY
jgi:hypothetical protein